MGPPLSGAAPLLLSWLLASVLGSQEPSERDALCDRDGCLVVYFQRKTFLDAWRACKEKGGDLATVKRAADERAIRTLFSGVDLRHSRSKVQTWIGLLRQPRQCSPAQPLRGFSWTSGDQDTQFTAWRDHYSPATCSVPRCVAMGYDALRPDRSFQWQDGSCSVPVEAFLCRYASGAMCAPLRSPGAGPTLYKTPFHLSSTLLTHVPPGSEATVACPGGGPPERSALCVLKEDGSAGWSQDPPLCPEGPPPLHPCQRDNGGCQHFCRPAAAAVGHLLCECGEGYELGEDGRSCRASGVCQGAPCQFECVPLADSFRCACPEGYMLAADGLGCLDVDECLQSPCEQRCLNSPGTFRCACRDGYRAEEGGACKDIDECADKPCEDACQNTEGSYVCHCRLGFSPMPEDQSQCQDIDECRIAGTCEQMCVNYEGGFECYCREGYELLNDNFSCGTMDQRSAATTPFDWDSQEYAWNPPRDHTDWPPDWLSDPTAALGSDVIWVTAAPQEEPLLDTVQEEGRTRPGDDRLLEQTTEPEFLSTPIPSTIGSSTAADWYEEEEEEEEETTAAPPHVSTSTISGGAWNWWAGLATMGQEPTDPQGSVTTDSSQPQEDSTGVSAAPQRTAPPTQRIPSQPSQLDVGQVGEGEDREQDESGGGGGSGVGSSGGGSGGGSSSSTWLLVGLLVPISILVVATVALAAVYCSRCSQQPRNKDTSDCYHWISGAHAPPSAGLKGHV